MKLFLYCFFRSAIYYRFGKIRMAQRFRLFKINEAIEELNRWGDIPLEYQRSSISRILNFPNGNYISRDFLTYIVINNQFPEVIAKSLPLSWYKLDNDLHPLNIRL